MGWVWAVFFFFFSFLFLLYFGTRHSDGVFGMGLCGWFRFEESGGKGVASS